MTKNCQDCGGVVEVVEEHEDGDPDSPYGVWTVPAQLWCPACERVVDEEDPNGE